MKSKRSFCSGDLKMFQFLDLLFLDLELDESIGAD